MRGATDQEDEAGSNESARADDARISSTWGVVQGWKLVGALVAGGSGGSGGVL